MTNTPIFDSLVYIYSSESIEIAGLASYLYLVDWEHDRGISA